MRPDQEVVLADPLVDLMPNIGWVQGAQMALHPVLRNSPFQSKDSIPADTLFQDPSGKAQKRTSPQVFLRSC